MKSELYLKHKIQFSTLISILLIFVSSLIIISSCKKWKKPNQVLKSFLVTYPISEVINSKTDTLYLNSICDSISYIPLQSDDSILLGRITKVALDDSFLFVFEKDQKVLLFDLNGKFIREIGKRGNDPGQYVRPIYFEIDKDNDFVIVYDDDKRQILFYDYYSKLLKIIKLNNEYFQFYMPFYNGELLAYTMKPFTIFNENFNIAFLSNSGTINSRLLKRDEVFNQREVVAVGLNKLYKFSDTISLWQFHYDTVYRILQNKTLVPRYVFNLGSLKMPMSYRNGKQFRINSTKYPTIRDVIEVEKYFFLKVINSDGLKCIIINKNGGEIIQMGNTGIINNVDLRYNIWPEGKINDTTLYMCINPIELSKSLKLNLSNNLKKEILFRLRRVNILDNPFIILIHLKREL